MTVEFIQVKVLTDYFVHVAEVALQDLDDVGIINQRALAVIDVSGYDFQRGQDYFQLLPKPIKGVVALKIPGFVVLEGRPLGLNLLVFDNYLVTFDFECTFQHHHQP
jgi:hypothetical protein